MEFLLVSAVCLGCKIRRTTVGSAGKHWLSLLFLLFCAVSAYAQNIDSLYQSLPEVMISGKKPLITYKDGKMVYNVKDDPESKNLDLMQSLRKMPIIMVSDNQEVSIAGSRKFKVLLNGKEYAVMEKNLQDLLKTIKAGDIDRYEVITEPSAKYSDKGYTAVLNIVTLSGRTFKGYSTNVYGNANSYLSHNLSAFGTVQFDKLILSAEIKNNNSWNEPAVSGTSDIENLLNPSVGFSHADFADVSSDRRCGYSVRVNASYEFDDRNLLNAEAYLMHGNGRNQRTENTSVYNSVKSPVYGYGMYTRSRWSNEDYGVSVNYQHQLSGKGGMLTFSYDFLHDRNETRKDASVTDVASPDSLKKYLGDLYDYDYRMPRTTPVHTFQADYAATFGSSSVDAGVKYINRKKESRYRKGSFDEEGELLNTDYSDMSDLEEVMRLYGEYSYRKNKLMLSGRLFYDYSRNEHRYQQNAERNFGRTSHTVIPHVVVTYQFSPRLRMVAESKYSVLRPDIAYLNPFVEEYPQSRSYGNPDLDNEIVFSASAMMQYFTQKMFSMFTVSAFNLNNGIEKYSWTDANGVINSTYGNINRHMGVTVSNYTNYRLGRGTMISVNPFVYYNRYRCPMLDVKKDVWTFQCNVVLQQALPLGLSLQAMASGKTKEYGLQYETDGYFRHSLTLSRYFLKNNALQVLLQADNPFMSDDTRTYLLSSDSFVRHIDTTNSLRSFSLSVRLNLGKLQMKVKRTKTSIVNDDVKEFD